MGLMQKDSNLSYLDGLAKKKKESQNLDWPGFCCAVRKSRNAELFSRRGRSRTFYTDHSRLYYTPDEYRKILRGSKIFRIDHKIESASPGTYSRKDGKVYSLGRGDVMYRNIKNRYSNIRNYFSDLVRGYAQGVSLAKVWNVAIVGAIIFGMFSMTMVYRYLGQGVSAKVQEKKEAVTLSETQKSKLADSSSKEKNQDINEDIDTAYITKLFENYDSEKGDTRASQIELEKEIRETVKGYPIEKMAGEIAKKDRIVAAFLVAIARKESSWGKHVPVLNGQDCYNYWGYRGVRDRMGTGGHTCFDSPKDAVDTVAKRIEFLVSNKKLNTPDKMVIWKCGSACSQDNQQAVRKWISDVDVYFEKLNK